MKRKHLIYGKQHSDKVLLVLLQLFFAVLSRMNVLGMSTSEQNVSDGIPAERKILVDGDVVLKVTSFYEVYSECA